MKYRKIHPWDLSPKDAIAVQETLRHELVLSFEEKPVARIAGIDVGFDGESVFAAVAILDFPGLDLEEYAISRLPATFPYVPGLLSFREVPVVLDSLEKLEKWPDLLLCDGQGIAHPRRLGIASHLGLLTGIPSIGVAKTRLVGTHGPIPDERGAWVPLMDKGEVIGAVLRTRCGVKPIYVSPGHKMDLEHAISFTMAATTRYRLPETTRWAHRLASRKLKPT